MGALLKFKRRLPSNIREQLVSTTMSYYLPDKKITQGSTIGVFLLSATEMCQNAPFYPCEGRPLEYYIHNIPEWEFSHWLRTPYFTNPEYWCGVIFNCVSMFNINDKMGIAPAFCTK